jgi:hypothetical protein
MNTILNVSEYQFEEGIFARLEASLRNLLHQAIHGEIENVSKRHISNGVWEPLPGSLSYKMWLAFEQAKLNPNLVEFKKITILSLEKDWVYRTTFREFERWRLFKIR